MLALALIIPLSAFGQQTKPAAKNETAPHETGKADGRVVLSEDKKPPHDDTAAADDKKHDAASHAQQGCAERLWGWLRSRSNDNWLLFVTTLYLFATIMIWGQMVKSNDQAKAAYEGSQKDTAESLRIASAGQLATERAVKTAEDQLAAILGFARARLAVEDLTHLPIVELGHRNIITAKVINRGHTPAVGFRYEGLAATTNKGQPIEWETLVSEPMAEFGDFQSVAIVGAGLSGIVPIEIWACTDDEIAAIRDGSLELHLRGIVEYADVFQPKIHTFEFTAFYSPTFEKWVVGSQTEK